MPQATTQATQATTQATQATTQATQAATQTGEFVPLLLTEAEQAILRTLLQNPDLTQREVALELGWTVDRVKYYLGKLKKRGIVRHVGTSQKGHWSVLADQSQWDH